MAARVCVQTTAFEPELAEALPYKAAIAVAAEMVGLLEGSSRVKPRRGVAGSLRELDAVPQVCCHAINIYQNCISLIALARPHAMLAQHALGSSTMCAYEEEVASAGASGQHCDELPGVAVECMLQTGMLHGAGCMGPPAMRLPAQQRRSRPSWHLKALPPGKSAAVLTPSPVLSQLLLTAARWLVAVARLSMARMSRLLNDPCLAPYRVRQMIISVFT